MAKPVAKGDRAIAKAAAKANLRKVELRVWYVNGKIRKRIVEAEGGEA